MKAIRVKTFGEPEVMQLQETTLPEPSAREVLVKIYAAGVNPVDTYIRSGWYPLKPKLPYTPGMDGAGIVEKTGKAVEAFKPGDRVYVAGSLSGTYAQFALCDEGQVYPLPQTVDFPQGAAIGVPYATAYYALVDRAGAEAGQTVLVHGASGGVGIAAVQLAHARGLRVMGTGGTEAGRRLVAEQGADEVLDHSKGAHFEKVLDLTKGRGVDIILEMLANVNLANDLACLAPGGKVVVIGSRGKIEIDPREIMKKNASILGMTLMNVPAERRRAIHEELISGLERGILRPVIGKQYPLAEAPSAHQEIMRPGAYGKIILLPSFSD